MWVLGTSIGHNATAHRNEQTPQFVRELMKQWGVRRQNQSRFGKLRRGGEIVRMIRELQPACLINNRLAGIGADYGTPEQTIPGSAQASAFEVCQTMNKSWGYNQDDHEWKDAKKVVFELCDCVGKGGNYLLNVGPDSAGVIPSPSVQILSRVGEWLAVNGEAIYGATPGPSMDWQEDVKMVTRKPGRDYLHLFDWPNDGRVFYYEFPHRFRKAWLLADLSRSALEADVYPRSLMLHVPKQAPDPIDSVLVTEYETA